jgi:ionotropic glutamate receptor
MELWESGIVRYWVNNIPSNPKARKCLADTKREVTGLVPIKLSYLISDFFILGIGLGLAAVNFLLEMIISKFRP